jgi:type VI protein secretion system component Hcp
MTDTQRQLPVDAALDAAEIDDADLSEAVGGTEPVDASSPSLFQHCANGKHIPTGKITV